MHSHFTTFDWVVLAMYFAGTMGVAFYCHRRSRSAEGFTAAGRSLPGWVCGLSIFATFLSTLSFLGLPGKAFGTNWNFFVFSLSIPLAVWIAVRWFVPYYRASGEVSAYAHLEHRFGPWARAYAGVCFLLTQIARIGSVTYLMALPLAVLTGLDVRVLIVALGAAVAVYSTVGGLTAVIWTDAFQALVLMAGMALCLYVILTGMPEGPGQVFALAAEHDKFSLGSFGPSLAQSTAEATFWVVLLYGLFTNLQNFGVDQGYVQRYVAAESDAEARKSVILGGLLYVPVSATLFFIGTCLFAWYSVYPEDRRELAQVVSAEKAERGKPTDAPPTDPELGDRVFPHFIGKRLPPGITGLVIAAVLSAGMSTVSTSLNSSATLLLSDYYQRYLNPQATERQAMRVLHLGTIVWAALGTGVALLLVQVQSALDAWWTLASIFSGGIVGLFLLGLISRRAGNPEAVTAVLVGALLIVWMTFTSKTDWFGSPFHKFLVIVIGTLTILLVGLLLSRTRVRSS